MDRKLVKEIVTTETEKFTDDGVVKERIKETREKIYSDMKEVSTEEIDEAVEASEVKEESKEEVKETPREKTQDELIREAAAAMDKANATNPAPVGGSSPYNVVSRNTPPAMGPYNPAGTKFP